MNNRSPSFKKTSTDLSQYSSSSNNNNNNSNNMNQYSTNYQSNQPYKQQNNQQLPEFLNKIHGIIHILKLKHSQSANQFTILFMAIKQYYNSLQDIINQKNRAIFDNINQNTNNGIDIIDQNLKVIIQQMGLYLNSYFKLYSDPNMKKLNYKFSKILEMHELRYVDADKFVRNKRNIAVQTFAEGHDIYGYSYPQHQLSNQLKKLQKQLEQKNNSIRLLDDENSKLNDQNTGLKYAIEQLENQREGQKRQYAQQVQKLREMLQNMRTPSQNCHPDNNQQNTYRSQPEINNIQQIQQKRKYRNLLNNLFEEMQNHQNQEQNQQLEKYKIQDHVGTNKNDRQDQWRIILTQASALEQTIKKINIIF